MDLADDDLLELIRQLDPMQNEQPPEPGSGRYRAILTAAVGDTVDTPSAVGTVAAPVASAPRQADADHPAAAAVRHSAAALGDVTSFEGERVHVEPGVSVDTMTLRVDSDDVEFVSETRFADGRIERLAVTALDGVQYVPSDGRTQTAQLRPGDGLDTPYGRASAALVAAVTGSDITEEGTQTIGSVLTTRYDVAPTAPSIASLSSLPPEDRNWFDLDEPHNVEQFTVGIADDHIHRVEIAHRDGTTTRTTFFSLNGDVTITPPPGPYEPCLDCD